MLVGEGAGRVRSEAKLVDAMKALALLNVRDAPRHVHLLSWRRAVAEPAPESAEAQLLAPRGSWWAAAAPLWRASPSPASGRETRVRGPV